DRSEETLRAFAVEHPGVAIDEEHAVVSHRITELSTLLTRAEGSRVTMESRYEFLTAHGTDPLSYFLDRPGVQKLRLTLLDLAARRATVADRLGGKHPEMIEIDQQANAIERQLGAEVKQEVAAVRARYQAMRMREDRLRRKLDAQEESAVALQSQAAHYEMLKK